MFQLFSHRFSFQKADKADVIHSGDWDDLGHGFDKYLRTVTVEWDLSLAPTGTSVILQLDIVNGIGGGTLVSNVGQFTLTGDRSKCTFPIAVDSIAKLIRLYPITTPLPIGFKQWKYTFDKTDYPADIIFSTEWKAAQSPNEENPTWVWVDMDTAGVPCACQLMNETGDVFPFTHTGSVDSRKNSYPIPADTFGKMWRLILTPGANGKAQVFAYGLSRWAPFTEQSSEAPPYSLLWTPWRDAETNNDKNPTWVWVDADTAGLRSRTPEPWMPASGTTPSQWTFSVRCGVYLSLQRRNSNVSVGDCSGGLRLRREGRSIHRIRYCGHHGSIWGGPSIRSLDR
jgi:hypothetical protein